MLKRFGSCQKGAAAVEFALLLPVLMLITFGIIEFGLLMYNQQILTNASREGARAGIVVVGVYPNRLPLNLAGEVCSAVPTPSINCVVQNYCANYLVTFDDAKPRPTPTCPDPISTTPPIAQGYSVTAPTGNNLGVEVKYEYKFLVPKIFPFVTGGKKTLKAVTVMRYE